MTIDDILREVHAKPFRPFLLHLASGRNVLVEHPDFFARSQNGHSITVYSPQNDRDMIDPALVASIITDIEEPAR